jgi:hypothetical protein
MEDMWRFRDKPVPLDFDLIESDQYVLRGQVISAVDLTADGILHPVNGDSGADRRLNGRTASLNGISANSTSKGPTAKSGQGLKDQRSLSLRETLTLFVSRSVSFHSAPQMGSCNRFKAPSVSQRASSQAKRRPYRLTKMMTIHWISLLPREICGRQLTGFQERAGGKLKVRAIHHVSVLAS